MKSPVEPAEDHAPSGAPGNGEDEKQRAILLELDRILESPFFRSSARSKQFLEYVVKHHLDGHPELLKERTIGTEVFQRPPGYATGEDPVVRVQAGEVRRRLEQYYQADPGDSQVRIELPLGSYSPVFLWHTSAAEAAPGHPSPVPQPKAKRRFRGAKLWVAAAGVVILAAAGVVSMKLREAQRVKTAEGQFWAPVFASQQPALICLAKPVVYRPTQDLYRRYARAHPGTFETEAERTSEPLPLKDDDEISWSDMYIASDYGVALGDTYAAVNLSRLMGRMGKPSQVRIGNNYSFEDLRNSPSVVVGAFNNKWTMQLMSNLHFSFVENHEDFMIREAPPGNRVWRTRTGDQGQITYDYAIVGRLLDSKTGQFTVTVAGISGAGTQAAGDLVSNPIYLERALRGAPAGWQTKNLELVLETPVTDSVPGPAHVVASYFW